MKVITVNAKDIVEETYENKFDKFVKTIIDKDPDIVSLQEVNQTLGAPRILAFDNLGYVPCKGEHIRILLDNQALQIAEILKREGYPYNWTWIPLEKNDQNTEVGMAVFSKEPIEGTRQFFMNNKFIEGGKHEQNNRNFITDLKPAV